MWPSLFETCGARFSLCGRLLIILCAWASLTLGCTSEPATADPHAAAQADYVRYCGLCHADNGSGYVAPRANALSNDLFLAASSDSFLQVGIREGRPGTKMSAWGVAHGGPLDEAQIDGLVALMRSWQKRADLTLDEAPLQGTVAAGAPIYAEQCAGCHGAKGGGGSALSLNHAIFLKSATDGFLRASIQHGRSGTPMPAYNDTLSATEIDSLVRVIRSFAPGS